MRFRTLACTILAVACVATLGCSSIASRTNSLSDERILSETGCVLGLSPSDLTLVERRAPWREECGTEWSRLPIARAVRDAARHLGADAGAWATSGGEDYELLLTCEPAAAAALADGLVRATGTPLTVIGHASAGAPEIEWTGARGERLQISAGFEHFHG